MKECFFIKITVHTSGCTIIESACTITGTLDYGFANLTRLFNLERNWKINRLILYDKISCISVVITSFGMVYGSK